LILLDGRAVAGEIRQELSRRVASLPRPPGLAVILVGRDPASEVYVRQKERACREVGIKSRVHRFSEDAETEELLELIRRLNEDPMIDAILVQSPVPPQVDFEALVQAIDPEKDADGFHPLNLGRMLRRLPGPRPCTPQGVMELLRHYSIPVRGRTACVVGRSLIVGRPLALMLLSADATVTVCHRHTADLARHTREADILCVAVGHPGLITREMVKKGAVVVDIGISRVGGKVVGDVDPGVREVAGALSPVPGGVGPMTVAMLLFNTVEAACKRFSS